MIDFYITNAFRLSSIMPYCADYRNGCGLFDLAENCKQNARWSTIGSTNIMLNDPSCGPVFTMRPFIRQFYDDETAQQLWKMNVG